MCHRSGDGLGARRNVEAFLFSAALVGDHGHCGFAGVVAQDIVLSRLRGFRIFAVEAERICRQPGPMGVLGVGVGDELAGEGVIEAAVLVEGEVGEDAGGGQGDGGGGGVGGGGRGVASGSCGSPGRKR